MIARVPIVLLALVALAAAPSSPPARPVVVIGDLHMGPGRGDAGWHPFEDFRWHDEFLAFLDAIDRDGGGRTDLVINGDLFELLQSETVACAHAEPRLGCTADEAQARLDVVVRAHAAELAAIGRFAGRADNRVHVVPGDHDAALLLPSVWARALAAFAAPDDRVRLAVQGHWTSSDGRVHVEHGHQRPTSADRFSAWPSPGLTAGGRVHVERPWGEQVALPIYDRSEARRPLIDNVAEEGVGVKYVAADAGADEMPGLLRYLLTKTTWQQFRMDLDEGDVQAPQWNLQEIRRDLPAFLIASIPADDPIAAPLVAARHADLAAIGARLTDEDVVAICDYRAALRRARRRMERVLTQLSGVGAPMPECPRLPDTIGPAFEYYWRTRDRQARSRISGTPDVVVFGHTHLMDRPFRPQGDDGPVVVTSGAWQRTIHPVQLERLDAPPESLPPCYTFLTIAAGPPRTATAHAWRQRADDTWTRAGSCTGPPP